MLSLAVSEKDYLIPYRYHLYISIKPFSLRPQFGDDEDGDQATATAAPAPATANQPAILQSGCEIAEGSGDVLFRRLVDR